MLISSSFYFIICVARMQPDVLGIFLSLLGLYFVVRAHGRIEWVLGIMFCALAILAKQQYFGAMLSVILFYVINREYKKAALAAGIILCVLIAGVGLLISERGAYTNLFCMQGGVSYTLEMLMSVIKPFIVTFVPLLCVIFILTNMRREWLTEKIGLFILYMFISIIIAVISLPKEGSGFYYLFEGVAGIGVVFGITMNEIEVGKRKLWLIIFIVMYLCGSVQSYNVVRNVRMAYKRRVKESVGLSEFISKNEKILYMMPGQLMRADKQVYIADVFSFKQFLSGNESRYNEFERYIKSGYYDLIILKKPIREMSGKIWGKQTLGIMGKYYHLLTNAHGHYLYVYKK